MAILSNSDIDKKLWNQKLMTFAGHSIPPYGFAEYLDIVCPKWKAIWDEERSLFMPITTGGILRKKIARAPFCQQLPVFGDGSFKDLEVVLKEKFSAGQFGLRRPGDEPNYILSLQQPYQDVLTSFNTNRKRALKKAIQGKFEISQGTSINAGIQLMNTYGPAKLNRKEEMILTQLSKLKSANIKTEIIEVQQGGIIQSVALFMISPNRITYLFGASTPEGQKINAPTLLFNHMIKRYENSTYTLDFEGSKIEGVAKFYQSLGGKIEPYQLWKVK